MAKTPNIDTEKLKVQGQQLRDAVAVHAGRVAVRAADLAEQGLDWAAPRAQAALEKVIETATDRAQEAVDQVQPFLSDIHGHVVDDYLPRINRAVNESAAAFGSEGDLAERARAAREASALALTTPTRKARRHPMLRALGLTALTATVAGASYVLWKRSQPIEDPWAEEYWADLEAESFDEVLPVESLEEAVPESSEEDEA